MEEQRQRQEEEAHRVTAASGEEASTPEAPIVDSEEAMLQQALSMSTPQTPVFDFSAMTEEQRWCEPSSQHLPRLACYLQVV